MNISARNLRGFALTTNIFGFDSAIALAQTNTPLAIARECRRHVFAAVNLLLLVFVEAD